jgi:phosphoglycerate dehydrogenase-like enzyme
LWAVRDRSIFAPMTGPAPAAAATSRLAPLNGRALLNAAFVMSPDMFELIYGDECAAPIGAHAQLLGRRPEDPNHLRSGAPGWLEEVDVVFTGWSGPRFDEDLLRRLPRLHAVFHGGGTVRPHVTEAFWERGILLTTAAEANAAPVAEFATAAIWLSLKRAWQLNRQVRHERTFSSSHPDVPGARGSTVGLVSLGLIGRLVRERLRVSEVRVIAHDPYVPAAQFEELNIEPVSLPELMAQSDVISLHTPLTAETEGLVTRALLHRLKPGATFINTARGALVREPDLAAFLRERPDVQAILDVTWPMPPAPDSPLYDLPNVFLTPHIAGSLGPECRRLGWTMVEEFRRHVRGEPLRHRISRAQAERQT